MKYIYAIKFGKYVKIGITSNLVTRFRAPMHPHVLTPCDLDESHREPLCAFPGELETERFLHGWLSEYRVEGEFFVLPDAVVEKLRQHNTDSQRDQLFQLGLRKRWRSAPYSPRLPSLEFDPNEVFEPDF